MVVVIVVFYIKFILFVQGVYCVCVDLCAVFRLIFVLFCMCIFCVLCLILVRLPPGRNPFAVKINNNNII
jgi:hypothetical protein